MNLLTAFNLFFVLLKDRDIFGLPTKLEIVNLPPSFSDFSVLWLLSSALQSKQT